MLFLDTAAPCDIQHSFSSKLLLLYNLVVLQKNETSFNSRASHWVQWCHCIFQLNHFCYPKMRESNGHLFMSVDVHHASQQCNRPHSSFVAAGHHASMTASSHAVACESTVLLDLQPWTGNNFPLPSPGPKQLVSSHTISLSKYCNVYSWQTAI